MSKKFIVRVYDGFDHQWTDVTGPLDEADAKAIWLKETNGGTEKKSYDDIDYYKIFPADTTMYFSGGRGEHKRGRE